jgi:diguanylate cyclase (GGDEF)-like protein
MRRSILTIAALLFVAGLGWVDYQTGPDIGFSLFYLIPIAICGWYVGRAAGVIVAVAAALTWFVADLAFHVEHWGIFLWNAFTRLVIYTTQAWTMASLRSDREALKRRVHQEAALARTDVGTSLPNVRSFTETADSNLEVARRNGWPVCLLYIDLDDFKQINDRFGHDRGDEVLRSVGDAISSSIRGDDVPARIGGDEFVVLLMNSDRIGSELVARRIHERIANSGPAHIDVTATIGAAYFSRAPQHASDLLASADRTMYAAKQEGKRRVLMQDVDIAATA